MPRSGTSFLYHNLQKNPSAFLPHRKELNYFSMNYGRGKDWYLSFFRNAGNGRSCFDISPGYFLSKEAAGRMKDSGLVRKVVLGVRRPVDFVLSLYLHIGDMGFNRPPLKDFIRSYRAKDGDREMSFSLSGDAILRSIREYQFIFNNDIMLYDFEHFRNDRLSVLREIESFTGLRPYFNKDNFADRCINSASRRRSRLLDRILAREKTRDIICGMFPGSFLKKLRNMADIFNSPEKAADIRGFYAEDDVAMAEEMLSGQDDEIKKLFNGRGIIRGDITLFDP